VRANPVVGRPNAGILLVDTREEQTDESRVRHAPIRAGPAMRARSGRIGEAAVVRCPRLIVALAAILTATQEDQRLLPGRIVGIEGGGTQRLDGNVVVGEIRTTVSPIADAAIEGLIRFVAFALVE